MGSFVNNKDGRPCSARRTLACRLLGRRRWLGYSAEARDPFQTRVAMILSFFSLRKKEEAEIRSVGSDSLFSSKVQWSAPCHSPNYKRGFLCFCHLRLSMPEPRLASIDNVRRVWPHREERELVKYVARDLMALTMCLRGSLCGSPLTNHPFCGLR